MLYSALVRTAMRIACQAHDGQLDKSGYPYIHHPLHLAEQMETELETITALLHDVAEDTPVTFAQMQAQGIPAEAIAALQLLCHDKSIPYFDYIRNLRGNQTALRVKRADLLHNLDKSRLPEEVRTSLTVQERSAKYTQALAMVEQYLSESEKF